MFRWLSFLLFNLVLLSGTVCFAQGSGKVSGKLAFEDGSPVSFALIAIQDLKKHTTSDENGAYELINIPFGHHLLEITSIEIERTSVRIHVKSASVVMPLVLKKAAASVLDEIVVEGESEKTEAETKGFAVNVIETKEMALKNFQTNDLLDRTVGVRVRQNGGLGSAVDYNLNGMSGNSVRLFIDGIPISTYGPSFSLNSIPPALIERIEVYKGVIPAHLADDALGGAINVVLKKGFRNNLNASVSYGSFNTFQANLTGMYRSEKSGFTARASAFHNYSDNDYEVWGKFVRNILPNGRYDYVKARRFNDAYKSTGGQVEVGFTDVKWADRLMIGYNGSEDYNEIQHGTYMSIPYKGRFTTSQAQTVSLNYQKTNLFVSGLEATFNGVYSKRSQVVNDTVRWNYNWYGEKSVGLNGRPIRTPQGAQQGAPTINHVNRNVATFRTGINYDLNDQHRIVFSHAFYSIDRDEQDEMRSAVEREFIGTRDLKKNISSLGYEVKAFDARLKTNFFGKYYQQAIDRTDPVLIETNGESVRSEDRASSNKTATGYGLALSYEATRRFTLLVSAEKAVRMPAENEIFGSPGDNIVENPNINPEISNNLNVGFRTDHYFKSDHKLTLSGGGFLRDTRDKIIQRINPRLNDAVQTNPYENLGKTKSFGAEGEVSYSFKRKLDVMLNVSRFKSVFNQKYDPSGNVYGNYGKQLPNDPFFTINGSAQYSFNNFIAKDSRTNVSYNFGFVERFYTTWLDIEDFRTPRQFAHDVGISYMFPSKRLVISADAKNIFNKQVYDNFAVQKPGRALYIKLNYSIGHF